MEPNPVHTDSLRQRGEIFVAPDNTDVTIKCRRFRSSSTRLLVARHLPI